MMASQGVVTLARIGERANDASPSLEEVREIARHYLATVEQTLSAGGKTIRIDDEALELLVSQGYSLTDARGS